MWLSIGVLPKIYPFRQLFPFTILLDELVYGSNSHTQILSPSGRREYCINFYLQNRRLLPIPYIYYPPGSKYPVAAKLARLWGRLLGRKMTFKSRILLLRKAKPNGTRNWGREWPIFIGSNESRAWSHDSGSEPKLSFPKSSPMWGIDISRTAARENFNYPKIHVWIESHDCTTRIVHNELIVSSVQLRRHQLWRSSDGWHYNERLEQFSMAGIVSLIPCSSIWQRSSGVKIGYSGGSIGKNCNDSHWCTTSSFRMKTPNTCNSTT